MFPVGGGKERTRFTRFNTLAQSTGRTIFNLDVYSTHARELAYQRGKCWA
ncbi:hypothetical protein TUM17564_12380 [Citrobacter freundii]|nr:hypothetical protein TUM17564_12380 [Citrobacter freundii]